MTVSKMTAYNMINRDLLYKLIHADETAFKQLFDLYAKKVYNFILSYVKDPAEAEDITQNVFIKIWEARRAIDFNRSFEGFIFTIAYRCTIDFFRQQEGKLKKIQLSDLDTDLMSSSMSSDDLVNHHQLESLYHRALQSLPPKRKEIFILSRHEGLSNNQIAQKLNISVKTVENQMTSALATLKALFKNADSGLVAFLFLFFFN